MALCRYKTGLGEARVEEGHREREREREMETRLTKKETRKREREKERGEKKSGLEQMRGYFRR